MFHSNFKLLNIFILLMFAFGQLLFLVALICLLHSSIEITIIKLIFCYRTALTTTKFEKSVFLCNKKQQLKTFPKFV